MKESILTRHSYYYQGGFRFCVLAGVEEAGAQGGRIVGRWQDKLTELSGPKLYGTNKIRPIEEFVNSPPDPKGVLLFTRLFGPLHGTPKPGREFQFPIQGWYADQKHYQQLWDDKDQWWRWEIKKEWVETLTGEDDAVICQVGTLYHFLYLDICTCPRERLKKCARSQCPNPYFVAHHLRQNYCSDLCARHAQSIHKKQWWDKYGPEWRAQRQRAKKRQKLKVRKK